MKVLWIAPNGGNYKSNVVKGTGGWIGALEKVLVANTDIKLGITFFDLNDHEIQIENNVSYFPICFPIGNNPIQKLWFKWFKNKNKILSRSLARMSNVIDMFQPDIIHIWGIENNYSQIIKYINNIPFIVHIQGITSAYIYTYLPPSFSTKDLMKSDKWFDRFFLKRGSVKDYNIFKQRVKNELKVAPLVQNWIGRTEWDYTMSQMLSPESRYFYCDELMRDIFKTGRWTYHYKDIINIQSSISSSWYKGIDIILNTAKILQQVGVNFKWGVYGVGNDNKMLKYFEKKLGILSQKCNIVFYGNVDGATIKNALLHSDVYVHPSYIENSSNAIAEAMMLGVPVIAQNVGGNASMLKNDAGVLVAPNEPYILASNIIKMKSKKVADEISVKELLVAKNRQNDSIVIHQLYNIYSQIAKKQ